MFINYEDLYDISYLFSILLVFKVFATLMLKPLVSLLLEIMHGVNINPYVPYYLSLLKTIRFCVVDLSASYCHVWSPYH